MKKSLRGLHKGSLWVKLLNHRLKGSSNRMDLMPKMSCSHPHRRGRSRLERLEGNQWMSMSLHKLRNRSSHWLTYKTRKIREHERKTKVSSPREKYSIKRKLKCRKVAKAFLNSHSWATMGSRFISIWIISSFRSTERRLKQYLINVSKTQVLISREPFKGVMLEFHKYLLKTSLINKLSWSIFRQTEVQQTKLNLMVHLVVQDIISITISI